MTNLNLLAGDIPQRHLADLGAKAPSIPLAMFRYAVARFIEGQSENKPAAVRNELDTLAEAAIQLAAMLDDLPLSVRLKLQQREARHGCAGLSRRLAIDLTDLMGVAEMARRDAEQSVSVGRGLAPNTQLVRDLARGLRAGGGTVDARPNGELVQAFGIALSIADRHVKDAARTVASALRSIEGAGKE